MQVLHQRRRVGVHRVPNKPGPRVDPELDKLDLAARIPLGEVIAVGHGVELAIVAPLPAVVGTVEALLVAVAPCQPLTTVAAGVVERAERSVGLLRDDDRLVHEVVDDIITGFFELSNQPGHVPDLGPHVVPLALHELGRVVALAVDRITAEPLGRAQVSR